MALHTYKVGKHESCVLRARLTDSSNYISCDRKHPRTLSLLSHKLKRSLTSSINIGGPPSIDSRRSGDLSTDLGQISSGQIRQPASGSQAQMDIHGDDQPATLDVTFGPTTEWRKETFIQWSLCYDCKV